jgi:hypothetical protein
VHLSVWIRLFISLDEIVILGRLDWLDGLGVLDAAKAAPDKIVSPRIRSSIRLINRLLSLDSWLFTSYRRDL